MLINQICRAIDYADGTPYFVGGCVRDGLLGERPKDWDVEVFNMNPDELKQILSQFGQLNEVGRSFGVFKLRTTEGEIDFSIPRQDRKAGEGHQGFLHVFDPIMNVGEAASRRDFTINSIYRNAVTGELHDYFKGLRHLRMGHLQHVNVKTFGDDPLRVLRGMQFVSRLQINSIAGTTVDLCKKLATEYYSLPVERIHEEWVKWAVKAKTPSLGLEFLKWTQWDQFYPEIRAMNGVPQDLQHHPEGNVDIHVAHVCNAMAKICEIQKITGEDREVLMWAALTHDMGKPSTTVFERGRWRSPGHAAASIPITRNFLKSIGVFQRVIDRVLPLVAEHMWPIWETPTQRTVRRLQLRLEPATIDELLLLMEADRSGRPPIPPSKPENHKEIVKLAAPKIEPLITGHDFLNLGMKEGPQLGQLKKIAFDAQMNEEFTTRAEGLQWMLKYIKEHNV